MIRKEDLERGMDYPTYKRLLEDLLKQGKTTGHEQQKFPNAQLNFQRMLRTERDVKLEDELREALSRVTGEYYWVVITEGWCADTARQIPVYAEAEKACGSLRLVLLLRDDNPQVMEQYLTNGTRSIPKLICVRKSDLTDVFVWGPRPAELQKQVLELKARNAGTEEKALMLQKWYNTDKTRSVQAELAALVKAHMT